MISTPLVSRRRARSALSVIAFGPTLVLLASSARGQDMTTAGAQLLDAEGTELLNQRKLAAACPKLEQSYRLQPGTGVLLRLALCQELSGRSATALTLYLEAAERAKAADNQALVQLAKNRAAALQPRLSHLTVDLDPSVRDQEKLRIWCDGKPLELTTLGAGLPLDPGSHVIEAEAPNRKRFQETIVVSDEPRRYSLTITLPLAVAEVEAEAASKPQSAATDTKRSWSTQHSLALAAGGVGLAGVTAGTFLGLAVGSQMRRARALCSDGSSGCSEEALSLQDQARGYSTASTIAFCAGAAGILGGVVLWLSAPRELERPRDARIRVEPSVGLESAGIQAVGTW
jgi:hypothetical protein